MEDENNPSSTVPDAGDVAAAVGTENVSQTDAQLAALSVEEINALTGRKYATKEDALAGIKETFSFVGKKVETPVVSAPTLNEPTASDNDLARQVKEMQFFNDNPDYNNADAKELIKRFGGDPEEVVKDPTFIKAFKAIQSVSENDTSESVMRSNSRQGSSSSDYQSDMDKAIATGDWASFMSKHKGVGIPKD